MSTSSTLHRTQAGGAGAPAIAVRRRRGVRGVQAVRHGARDQLPPRAPRPARRPARAGHRLGAALRRRHRRPRPRPDGVADLRLRQGGSGRASSPSGSSTPWPPTTWWRGRPATPAERRHSPWQPGGPIGAVGPVLAAESGPSAQVLASDRARRPSSWSSDTAVSPVPGAKVVADQPILRQESRPPNPGPGSRAQPSTSRQVDLDGGPNLGRPCLDGLAPLSWRP